MALLTTINDPFNPRDKTVDKISAGKKISSYLPIINEGFDVVISRNGLVIEEDAIVMNNDHFAIVAIPKGGGGGSNPLRVVAMLALTLFAPGLGTSLGSALFSGTAMTVGMQTAIGTMVVMSAGSLLINAVLPPPQLSAPSSSLENVSPTYAFNGGSNAMKEGTALPIMLGEARVVPPRLSSYLSLDGDKQYLNMLFAVNDGEVDSISDITINGQSVSNFENVNTYTTLGTNNQNAIGNFREAVDTVNLDITLDDTATENTYTTIGNAVEELEVVVAFPKGLYRLDDQGNYNAISISFSISYRKVGESIWNEDSITVNDVFKTTKRLAYNYKSLSPAQYEIKVKRLSDYDTDTRVANSFVFNYVNEIVYDSFTYPNVALLSINALATDQLNGSFPTVSCICKRSATSNPALGCKEVLNRHGVDDSKIDFDEWATWCDTKGYKVGLYLDSQQELQEALNMISLLGRATVVQMGNKFVPIIDREVDIPVDTFLFTAGNSSNFSINSIPYSNRANVIEVTYYDKLDSYKAKTVQVQSIHYDSKSEENKASVNLYGCTDRQQALNYAKFLLNWNQYITESVNIVAGIDAIACGVGDVIRAGTKYMTNTLADGRIVSATADSVVLDQQVLLEAGVNYEIQIRLLDNNVEIVDVPPLSVDTLTDTISVSTMQNIPEKFDVYAFGQQDTEATNLYRVVNISRDSDYTRKIKGVEYNPTIYSDLASVEIEDVVIVSDIMNLQATESLFKRKDGTIDEILTLSWDGRSALRQDVFLNGIKVGYSDNNNFEFKNKLIDGQSYTFKVGNKSVIHEFLGKSAPPSDIINFNAQIIKDNIILTWDNVSDVDLNGYQIWVNGEIYNHGLSGNVFTFKPTESSYEFKIKAIDTSGILSENYAITNLNITLPTITRFYAEVIDNNVLLRWDATEGTLPIVDYNIYKGSDFNTSSFIGSKNGTFTAIFERAGGIFKYWVEAIDSAGIKSTPKSLSASVSQPPDYVLNVDWYSIFNGSKTNALLDNETLLLLPNTTETWQEHFDNNSFTTPQDQINAGSPYYLQPTEATGQYQEVFDYGSILAATQINVMPTITQIDGAVSYTIDIEISTDNSTWTMYSNTDNIYATNFRYVRVTLHFTTSNGLGYLDSLEVRLDSKLIGDAGTVTANAGDTNGTVVTFNKPFVDITSLITTPQGTTPITAVRDFNDVPNPTQFSVYLFNNSGTRVSGDVSWSAKGY